MGISLHSEIRASRKALIGAFVSAVERFPERIGLEAGGITLSYGEFGGRAAALAGLIRDRDRSEVPLTGVFGYRSTAAYTGIIAAHLAGRGYVPLNPHYPVDRTQYVIERSGISTIIVGAECLDALAGVLNRQERPLTMILADADDSGDLGERFPRHTFVPAASLAPASGIDVPDVDDDALAYVIFTSGSTGQPKGVAIRQRSVIDYAGYLTRRYGMTETDRVAQFSDLTFDFSVHDLWTCWEVGAALCVVPREVMIGPARFIRDRRITCWASVPSVAGMLSKMRMLKPGAFPDLRVTVFCGEPLPVSLAQQWQAATPNGIVENIYGPTEATVAITHFRWETGRSEERSDKGIVPIGWAFEGQHTAVVAGDRASRPGEIGELLLGGSQVAVGYWRDPERTRDRFVRLPFLGDERWYRTGDLAWADDDGCLHFAGRIDNQVKVRGFRVELQDVEHAVRAAAGTEQVACVAWPVKDGSADGLVAFVAESSATEAAIIASCREHLPDYMVPKSVRVLTAGLPLNANGKVDRRALAASLDAQVTS